MAWTIQDAGVDWLTCTGNNKASRNRVFNLGVSLMDQERRRGNEKWMWSWEGYKGFKSGGVQVGARADGAILRLTGHLAQDHYLEAWQACDNVSRIDWQITARTDRTPSKVIAWEYRNALRWSKARKRGPTVDIWKSSRGSATCYVGSRSSERCGRIYDKGRESMLPVLEGCIRYEAELKGDAAQAWTKELAAASCPREFLVAQVCHFFRSRGCRPAVQFDPSETIVLHRRAGDRQRSLEWLRSQVRPTIKRLVDAGMIDDVIDCLQLRAPHIALVQQRRRRA